VEVHDEIEIDDDRAEGIGPQIELDLGTGFDHVRDFGDELFSEIEDHLGESFEKMGEIDLNEGEQTPTEPVPSIPTTGTLIREEPRKKRIKTTAGRTDLLLVQKFLGLKSKSSSSQPKKSSTKPSVQPTRKSFCLASQSTFKPVQSYKDEPILVEDIDSSAKNTPIKGSETASIERGSPLIAPSKPSLKRKSTARKIPYKHSNPHHLLLPNRTRNPKLKEPKPL